MVRITALISLIILWVVPALAQPVNEWTIERPTYTKIGNGIAYNDGTWKESDATIDYSNPTKWENLELPTPWSINTSNLTLTMSRGSQASTIRPDGVYWLNTTTWAVTEAAGWAVPVVTENPTSVFLDGMLDAGDGDAELISKKSGITWDYIFNDTTGWTANPYPVGESALVVRYQLGRNHTVTADGQAVDWGGTVASYVTFEAAGEKFDLATVSATDATGVENPITYYLRTAQGKDWFMEGIPAADFAAATLPLRYHYETKTGTISADQDWTGTVLVAETVSIEATVDVAAGTYVKMSNVGAVFIQTGTADAVLNYNGTEESPIFHTDCNTAGGEDVTSEAECDAGVTPDVDTARGLAVTITGATVNINYTKFSYCGGDAQVILVVGVAETTLIVQNSIFEKWHTTTNRAINATVSSSASEYDITLKNNIFKTEGTPSNVAGMYVYIYGPGNFGAEDTITIENNLFTEGVPALGNPILVYIRPGTSAAPDIHFNFNTIDCGDGLGTSHGLYLNRMDGDTTSTVKNNIAVGCTNQAFINSSGTWSQDDHSNNRAYNNGTNYTTAWNAGATELGTDPVLTEAAEADATWVPTWADGYHLGVGSSAIDTGSDTAVALGMDALHTATDHTVDSGTADIGFHYPVAEAACVPDEVGTELSCTDGNDNDCDGDIDAADSDCCQEDPEVSCSDGLDNDCDTFVDGDDPDCAPASGTCSDNGWWGGSEFESIVFMCDRLSILEYKCFSETIGTESIVNNRFSTSYSGLTLAPMLRVWDSLANSTTINNNNTEINSLKSICTAYDSPCPQDRTEVFYWNRIAECMSLE